MKREWRRIRPPGVLVATESMYSIRNDAVIDRFSGEVFGGGRRG
jgi:hypothetical protein